MNIFFFINGHKVDTSQPRMTGIQIKQAGHVVDPSVDFNQELVLEGTGSGADEKIPDDKEVDLTHDHGQGPKHFFTRPPTNFGSF
jgi:hypothetical protein